MRQFDDPVIVARDLGLTYRLSKSGSSYILPTRAPFREVRALADVSFAVNRGEFVGILGRNGSGKSSLLSIISGNVAPTKGEVLVSSRPSLLSVAAALQPDVSGYTNARLGLMAQGFSTAEAKTRAIAIGEWAELGEAFHRPLKTYSSGMKARLKFAIATETASEILLVDEALSTGDSTFNIKARERMSAFLEESGTVIVVSHSAAAIRRQCSRVIWINEGRVIADGDTGPILSAYEKWNKHRAKGNQKTADALIQKIVSRYEKPVFELLR